MNVVTIAFLDSAVAPLAFRGVPFLFGVTEGEFWDYYAAILTDPTELKLWRTFDVL